MEFRYKNIQIGQFIEALVAEKAIDEDRICTFFKIDTSELQKMYESKNMDTGLLLRWSKLLEYDFFRIYSQHLLLYAPPSKMNLKKNEDKKKSVLPSFTKSLYTPEIIQFIIELIELKKKTPTEIIEQYRIPKTTLYKWIRKHKKTKD